MRSNGRHGHDAGSRCPVCASILAAARQAGRSRRSGNGRTIRRRNGAPPADRVWEAALLGHLQLVSGLGEGSNGD